jgi:hypothetical protein
LVGGGLAVGVGGGEHIAGRKNNRGQTTF